MSGHIRRPRMWTSALVLFAAIHLLTPVASGDAAADPTPASIGLQASDVPGFTAIDPSIESFQDPNDQGFDQAFIQCASSNSLLSQFDTGPDATVSTAYGQGQAPLGAPALSVGSAVFTDGSSQDERAPTPCWQDPAFNSAGLRRVTGRACPCEAGSARRASRGREPRRGRAPPAPAAGRSAPAAVLDHVPQGHQVDAILRQEAGQARAGRTASTPRARASATAPASTSVMMARRFRSAPQSASCRCHRPYRGGSRGAGPGLR